MSEYLWPWQSHVFILHPWAISIMFIVLSLLLSMISWFKKK
ncbi:hypothetical protein [Paenibacillus agri]|nr:hypothetical protein [Paenibacillus agri]